MEKYLLKAFLFSVFCSITFMGAKGPYESMQKELVVKHREMPMNNITPWKVNQFSQKMFNDLYDIGSYVFTTDTLKVAAGVLPFYLLGRQVEKPLHRKFYDAATHTNKNQPGKFLRKFLDDRIMAMPAVAYTLVGCTHKDSFERRTARMFGWGLLWTWVSKVTLKQIKCTASIRPKSAKFDRNRDYYGGNPSGHTSTSMFAAVYLGFTKGWKWAVPLGLYTGFIGSLSVACNRHFLSQVIAGAGLGAVFGVASHTALEKVKHSQNWELALTGEQNGGVGVMLAYNF